MNEVSFNSLGPGDAIWQQRSGSKLVQVMACCWRHQAITWTNIDWSSMKSSDIHIGAISQQMPQSSITKICLKITFEFPRANELMNWTFTFWTYLFQVISLQMYVLLIFACSWCWWLSANLLRLSNGDTAVLHWAIHVVLPVICQHKHTGYFDR